METDLFGNEITEAEAAARVPWNKGKKLSTGRASALPGPEGMTCRDCEHACYVQHAKRYYKCALRKSQWTGGAGTDIRLRDPACSRFEPVNPR